MSRIRGYPIVFNSQSCDLGSFYEIVRSSAVDRMLSERDDVAALVNHNADRPLARSTTGTLQFAKDAFGLGVDITVDDGITYVSDVLRSIQRGDCDGGSFSFSVESDAWSVAPSGMVLREVLDMRVHEVSAAVTFPAYAKTRLFVARQ